MSTEDLKAILEILDKAGSAAYTLAILIVLKQFFSITVWGGVVVLLIVFTKNVLYRVISYVGFSDAVAQAYGASSFNGLYERDRTAILKAVTQLKK